MPPLFASKSPFFVPVRQKFSHPVHGLPHFPLLQAALLFAEMFCRTGASSLCCCTSVLCFADEKSFPQKCGIQSVKGRSLFPHVENPVEKVQKSCFKACFTGGIPHFPPGFQQLLRKSLKTNAKKSDFFGKTSWKTRGKTWKSFLSGENLLKPPPAIRQKESFV